MSVDITKLPSGLTVITDTDRYVAQTERFGVVVHVAGVHVEVVRRFGEDRHEAAGEKVRLTRVAATDGHVAGAAFARRFRRCREHPVVAFADRGDAVAASALLRRRIAVAERQVSCAGWSSWRATSE